MNTKLRTMTVFILVTSLVMLSCAFVQSLAPASAPTSIPEAASTEIPALEATSTLRPTATERPLPTATPQSFAIQDESFQEYEKDCNTDVNITSVEADGSMGITVNSTITMLDGGWAVFCYGAKHTWIGTLTYAGYTFASDTNDPLIFMVDASKGYVYLSGKGTVTSPDGSVENLGGAAAPAALPSSIIVTECTSSDDCPDSVRVADLFEEDETLEYNTEYKVTISPDKKVRFYYGWCTIDQKTLDENLKDMKFVFTIDGISYLDNAKKEYYEQEDDTAPTKQIYCYGLGGVASGWQEAQTYKVVFGSIFEKEVNDGWDTYPKGENLRLYSFTVDSNGAASVPADWKGIPIMPGALSSQDYMGDYNFTIKASEAEIQDYYKREMPKLGWEYREDMVGSSVEQVFFKDGTYVFFIIATEGDHNIMYMHLVLP